MGDDQGTAEAVDTLPCLLSLRNHLITTLSSRSGNQVEYGIMTTTLDVHIALKGLQAESTLN